MPRAKIEQEELSALLSKRGRVRRGLADLRKSANALYTRVESGTEVTSGLLDLEISVTCEHGQMIRQLLLDGRPIDDVNGE